MDIVTVLLKITIVIVAVFFQLKTKGRNKNQELTRGYVTQIVR
jgi:hypothetical protein